MQASDLSHRNYEKQIPTCCKTVNYEKHNEEQNVEMIEIVKSQKMNFRDRGEIVLKHNLRQDDARLQFLVLH